MIISINLRLFIRKISSRGVIPSTLATSGMVNSYSLITSAENYAGMNRLFLSFKHGPTDDRPAI
jgi:hypothetical protein